MLDFPEPITLGEACQRVGVEYKQLYQRANQEARMIADRYRRHREAIRADREGAVREKIMEILDERLDAGYEGVSARDLRATLDNALSGVRNSFSLIREIRDGYPD
jgi:predicted site-specific integrase-resolvase